MRAMKLHRIAFAAVAPATSSGNVAAKGLYDPGKVAAPRDVQAPSSSTAAPTRHSPVKDSPVAPSVPAPLAKDLPATGLLNMGATNFWQGSWGIEGRTPVVTVATQVVSYEGANGQSFAVSQVSITASAIQFQVGTAAVSLTKRPDNNVEMISTIGANSSRPILLCKSPATSCP